MPHVSQAAAATSGIPFLHPLPRVVLREVGPPAAAAVAVVPGAVDMPGLPPPGHPPLPAGGPGMGGGIGLGPGGMAALGLGPYPALPVPVLPLASPVLPLAAPASAPPPADNMEMLELRRVLDELLLHKSSDKGKDKKQRKLDKKEAAKKKRRKEKKEMGESSSSESSSASSSSKDSHASDQKCKYIQCTGAGKKRRVTPDMVARSNIIRFKKLSDLVNSAQRYPGALAGLFMHQVRMRVMGAAASNSKTLQETDCTIWATTMSGLKDVRDVKETTFLVKLLLEVGHRRLPQAMDLIAQRLRELRMAKSDGSSWEKASVLSLLPTALPPNSQIPDTAFVL
jgi:hypothetical protein